MLKTSGTPHYENVPFEVPSSWEIVPLSELFILNPKNDVEDDVEVGFIPMTNVEDGFSGDHSFEVREWKDVKKGYCHFQNGDIGVAKISPCFENLKSCIFHSLPNGFGTGTTELVILRSIGVYSPFYLYLFKSTWYILQGTKYFKGVVGQQRVNKAIFTELEVPLPSYREQQRIVAEIEKWFALIAIIESGKTDLQAAIKQTKSKILDLAIHGKLVPQDPNDEPASELLKRINPNAEITCDNGQYGKLPEGWIDIPISLVCDMYQPQTISTADLIPNGKYPVYGANGIIGKYNLFNHPKSEILLTCRGATCGSINISKPFSWINGNAMVMHIKEEYDNSINKRYFAFFLMSTDKGILITGSAQPQITQVSLKKINIKIPPLAEQQRIVYAIEKAFGKLDAIMKSL